MDKNEKTFHDRMEDLQELVEFWSETDIEENGMKEPNFLTYSNPIATMLILLLKAQKFPEEEMVKYMTHGWKIVNLKREETNGQKNQKDPERG